MSTPKSKLWRLNAGAKAFLEIIADTPTRPELNVVENVWSFMHDNWLSNRIFRSYDDIVERCCHA